MIEARSKAYGEGFGTHIPLLASVVAIARPGPVVEVGVGVASSPLLAEMCHAMGREWIVWESEESWLANVEDLAPHPFRETDYAVAFIDCHGPLRAEWTRRLAQRAEFIVVHDTDNKGGLDEMMRELEAFPYRYTYDRMVPWTTVVSMTRSYGR